MFDNRYKRNISMDLGLELVNLNKTIAQQEMIIEELVLRGAMYKANFFGKYELSDKLRKQINENTDANIGSFDGFCYCSWRANAIYRNIRDMYDDELITNEEYNFCNGF